MRRLVARLALAAGIVLLVLVCMLLAVLPSQGEARARSVFSFEPSGLRAQFLLCESLGFRAEPWSDAPGHLAGPGTVLVLAALPDAPPDVPAAPPGAGSAGAPPRSRDLGHYRRFVEQGGTLLLFDTGETHKDEADRAELDFLRATLGLPGLEDLECAVLSEEVEPAVALVGDERLELGNAARRCLRASAPAEVLARAEDGSVLALARPVGAGRVALATLPIDWFDNRALAEHGAPALVFVRLLERLAPFERVLFDEYALGGWRPVPVLALAFSPRLAWTSVHLLLLLLVLGWRSAWSGPFPRDPEAHLAASPLARARGFGRTLARAGRWDLLASLLRRGVLARWDARAGQRTGEAELEARLRELARGDEQRQARLAELFLARAPQDERELTALEADLRALERELFPLAESPKTVRALGARASRTGS